MAQTITNNMTISEIAEYVNANSKSIFQNPLMINKIIKSNYDAKIQESNRISEAQAKRFAEIQEAKRIAEGQINHSNKSKSNKKRFNKQESDFRLNLPSFNRNSNSPPNTPLNEDAPIQMEMNETQRRMFEHQHYMQQQWKYQQWQQQQMYWKNQHVQMQSPTQQKPKFVFINNMMHIIN